MIQHIRKKLTTKLIIILIVAIFVIIAAASTWWYYSIPADRALAIPKIRAIVVFGLLASGTYALLALGFTLIYGVTEIVNMTHGALYMLGAYAFFSLAASFNPINLTVPFEPPQLDLRLALILAIIIVGIIGAIIYRLAIHPIMGDLLATLVVTIGISILFQEIILTQFGTGSPPLLCQLPELVTGNITILGESVNLNMVVSFASSLVLFIGLWIFISKSKIGKAMRAIAQDREAAMLMGINTDRLCMLTMAIAASLAAAAGILITMSTVRSARPYMWYSPLYMSFAIVILGGLGSIKGTFIGAFIIGYTENAVLRLAPEIVFLKDAVALAIMVLVLLIRPKGIFGKRIEMEE